MAALPDTSDIDLFGYSKRVVDFDTEIAHRAFQLRVPERVGFILRIPFLIERGRGIGVGSDCNAGPTVMMAHHVSYADVLEPAVCRGRMDK